MPNQPLPPKFDMMANNLKVPFVEAMSTTTRSLLTHVLGVKQNKSDCAQLLEQTCGLLNAIIIVHVQADTGGELPPTLLNHIGKFTETLHKIYTFIEAQQNRSKLKRFLGQGDMTTLLKDCKAGLQQGQEVFQIKTANLLTDIAKMQEDAQKRHSEVLNMIDSMSDATHSDRISTIYAGSHNRWSEESVDLDNLETSWEPTESREKIEEFLSLLTDVEHLALIITMRGSERPAKVRWTRPFLRPLNPLAPEATLKTFLDIADDRHDRSSCANVLSRWEREKTSIMSEGYDRRSNLDLSISLSLSSPRINSVPHSQELLSLLSILPDGLSDVELVQSKLPVDDIFSCKAALLYKEYHGTQSVSAIVDRISSNYLNFLNVLQSRLQPGHPDLPNGIYCICYLNQFSRFVGHGCIPLIVQTCNFLPLLFDYRLSVYLTAELIYSLRHYPIPNPDTMASKALEHLKVIDDTDLKCRFYIAMSDYSCECKFDMPAAVNFDEKAISLATSTGNTRLQANALYNLAWKKWQLGLYSEARLHAFESARLARLLGNMKQEADALWIQATCLVALGDYKESIFPLNRARDLLFIVGMAGGATDRGIMICQADVHELKSEYAEAHNIQTQILQAALDQDPYDHSFALLNIAGIEISMGVPKDVVQTNLETGKSILDTMGKPGARITMIYDYFRGTLNLREGDISEARELLHKSLRSCWARDSECVTSCLEILGDISRWGITHCVSSWTTVFLAHSLKVKDKLSIYKALQFLGDVFLVEDDTETAISLFTVALEGFTEMDVHRNRAECLLRIGDISKEHGEILKAADLWEMARPLFERSSQARQVQHIDERLTSICQDVLELQRANLMHLAELNAPSICLETRRSI
ncbi:hypothetical protein B0H13DRAFT_1923585 [Mycena leptocephala]|nr:hypothetical protein B0H13DRAFT_1923585 [Mycena leptocephala]